MDAAWQQRRGIGALLLWPASVPCLVCRLGAAMAPSRPYAPEKYTHFLDVIANVPLVVKFGVYVPQTI